MIQVLNMPLRAVVLVVLAACAAADTDVPDVEVTQSLQFADPPMRWDHLPAGETWTRATLAALETHGAVLTQTIPDDIDAWCPGYRDAAAPQRRAFWSGLLSTLAKHESTWRPDAVGGGGRWFGLVQIAPATARGYGCAAGSGEALKNGPANLSCAVRIWATTVPRDNMVSQNGRGVAADWGPFHQSSKRADMREWMQAQPYCAINN